VITSIRLQHQFSHFCRSLPSQMSPEILPLSTLWMDPSVALDVAVKSKIQSVCESVLPGLSAYLALS
jgi:hypothetical protein